MLYRGLVGNRRTIVAAFLQATSLAFLVAATILGRSGRPEAGPGAMCALGR